MDNYWSFQLTLSNVLQHSKGGFHAEQCALTCGFQNKKLGVVTFPSFPSTASFFANGQSFNCFSEGSVLFLNLAEHVMDRTKGVKCRKRKCLELFTGFSICNVASRPWRSQRSLSSCLLSSCTAPRYLVNLKIMNLL